MAYNYQSSGLVAAGDTVKTSIGEITFDKSGKWVGVWCYADAVAGLTTIVPNSGIFNLESGSINNLLPATLPLGNAQALTSGASSKDVKVWPMDLDVKQGQKAECFVTMDVAQTGERMPVGDRPAILAGGSENAQASTELRAPLPIRRSSGQLLVYS
jgi:hypothetical protein